MSARTVFAVATIAVLAACNANASQSSSAAQSAADGVTRAVYDNDAATVSAAMDERLKSSVSRTTVAMLSDKMHALGTYRGLTYLSGDESKHEFTYEAKFDKGDFNVVVRIDGNGRLAAYRVFPIAQ